MGLDFRDHTYRRYVVLGKRTVKDGEALLIWNRKGVTREVIGPALVYLYCSAIRFLTKYTAGPEEYLVVTKTNGQIEHIPGPTSLFQNPTIHTKVSVKPAIVLNASSECIVLHRQIPLPLIKTEEGFVAASPATESQQIQRMISCGPTVVFPGVGDKVLDFHWSCSNFTFEENASFQILNTAKRQVKAKGHVSFRGENKIKGVVYLLFTLQIDDVGKLVDSSNDLMTDLNNALEIDLNNISLLPIETIQEVRDLDAFGDLNTFPQMTVRANETGVKIDNVMYAGFEPDENLRHHIADLANVHAKYAKDCIVNEQNQQKLAMELSAKKDRLVEEEKYMKAEIEMKHQQLEFEHRYKQTQLENSINLRKREEEFELDMINRKNKEALQSLQALQELGVDLTKLLCSKATAESSLGLNIPAIDLGVGGEKNGRVVVPLKVESNERRQLEHH